LRDARSRPVAKTNAYGPLDLVLPAAWRLGAPHVYETWLALPAGAGPGGYTPAAGADGAGGGAGGPRGWGGGGGGGGGGAAARGRAAPGAARPRVKLEREFGGVATLEGVAAPAAARAGERVAVRLWWRADGAPDRDYAAYVHLVGAADARPLAQADGPA